MVNNTQLIYVDKRKYFNLIKNKTYSLNYKFLTSCNWNKSTF